MADQSYHVIGKTGGKWGVLRSGAERISRIYATKKEAITTARRLLRASGGGELIIHLRDGRVSSRYLLETAPLTRSRNGHISLAEPLAAKG